MRKTLAILAVGALLPLCANDSVRFGAQLSTETPTGNFTKQANQGIGLGAFATYDIGGGHAATVKLGVKGFGDKTTTVTKAVKEPKTPAVKDQNSAATVNLGLDYSLHFNKTQTGLYAVAGLDAERRRVNQEHKPKNAAKLNVHEYTNSVGYNLGVGYDLNKKMGAQVCYNVHNYAGHSAPVVSAAVTYTF